MLEAFCLIWTTLFLGGIVYILKKGFSEIIKALESIDKRLQTFEENLDKDT